MRSNKTRIYLRIMETQWEIKKEEWISNSELDDLLVQHFDRNLNEIKKDCR
jgi:hypothetical protein